LILLGRFSPIGFSALTLPFPYFSTIFFRFIYNLIFLVLYHFALPLAEVAYYGVFLTSLVPIDTLIGELMVAGAFAGMNFFACVFIIQKFFAVLLFTAISFGLMFGMIKVKKSKGLPLAATARIAFSFAILFWLIWLWMTRKGWLNRSQPTYNFEGNILNIWKRGGV
jgi:hypothetical protein